MKIPFLLAKIEQFHTKIVLNPRALLIYLEQPGTKRPTHVVRSTMDDWPAISRRMDVADAPATPTTSYAW